MHDCMGVVYQNKKPEEAFVPPELAVTDDKDAVPGAFHSQQQLAERPSRFRQYGAIIISSILPWRRDGTISLSRLASNTTGPTFAKITCFIQSPTCSCILKTKFVESKCDQCYLYFCTEVPKLPLKGNINEFQSRVINDMCSNVWKCVGVGIINNDSVLGFWLWDLICKFQSTFVVITDFLSWEIYISIFIYQFSSSELVITFFIKSSQDSRVQQISGCCFWFTLHWLSLQKGHLFNKTVVDLFTTVCFISLCRMWLHVGSDAARSGCAV